VCFGFSCLASQPGAVGGIVLAVALPRLVDPDGAVVEVEVADPQRGDLTEPQAGSDRNAEQVAVAAG
jgi:hypothetical protein